MKNLSRSIIALGVLSLMLLSSCKKDDPADTSTSVVQIVTTGSWRIASFSETDEDKTSDFSGYSFSFNSNGQLTASHSSGNTTGSWGWDDSSSKFIISIGVSKPLSELSDDWIILEKTENLVRLKNDNTLKNELLTFTRI